MNPLTNVKNIQKLNQIELEKGLVGKKSWHDDYRDSAWVFVGGLPYDLTEGDVLCVFSQYGEIVNMNFIRDKETGKPKGYCFICFEDQRSTVLTVDNINGSKIMGRIIRVDHVANYRMPKEHEDEDDQTRKIRMEGCAPQALEKESEEEEEYDVPLKKAKKEKKSHKRKKDKKKLKVKKQSTSDDSSSDDARKMSRKSEKRKKQSLDPAELVHIKKEKHDTGYNKYPSSDSKMMDRDIERKNKSYQESPTGRENKGSYSREPEVKDQTDDYGRRRKQPGEVEISLKVSYREKESPQQDRGYGKRLDREYPDEDGRKNRRRELGSENVMELREYQDADRYEKRKSWTKEVNSDRYRDSKESGNNYRDTDQYAEPSRSEYRTERPRTSNTRYEYSKRRSDFDEYRESDRGGDRKNDNYRDSDRQRDREDYCNREKSSYKKRDRTM